jgi:hypothetical protein
MDAVHVTLTVLLVLIRLSSSAVASPWVQSGDDHIPAGVIRVTTLGSGSPDVRKEQVQLG